MEITKHNSTAPSNCKST